MPNVAKVEKIQIGAPIPRALWKRVKKYAIDRGVTASQVLEEALVALMSNGRAA